MVIVTRPEPIGRRRLQTWTTWAHPQALQLSVRAGLFFYRRCRFSLADPAAAFASILFIPASSYSLLTATWRYEVLEVSCGLDSDQAKATVGSLFLQSFQMVLGIRTVA